MEIVGYENYLIYPDGKVQNKKTKRYLKYGDNSHGYYVVGLYKNGKEKKHQIHRLVALHYIPNPENKPYVDHINRDKSDNRVENLRWVSSSENNQNVGIRKDNKVGHKNIHYDDKNKRYCYNKMIRGKRHHKCFKTKTEALCYKYIIILKILAKI